MGWQHDGLGWHRLFRNGPFPVVALLIGGFVVFAFWLLKQGSVTGRSGGGRALSILKERYARGEIDKAEFDTRKRDIA